METVLDLFHLLEQIDRDLKTEFLSIVRTEQRGELKKGLSLKTRKPI